MSLVSNASQDGRIGRKHVCCPVTVAKLFHEILEASRIADALHEVTVSSFRVEKNTLNDVTKIVYDTQPGDLLHATPVGGTEGQVSLIVGVIWKSTEDGRYLSAEEIFEEPSRGDRDYRPEGSELFGVDLDLMFHCSYSQCILYNTPRGRKHPLSIAFMLTFPFVNSVQGGPELNTRY